MQVARAHPSLQCCTGHITCRTTAGYVWQHGLQQDSDGLCDDTFMLHLHAFLYVCFVMPAIST